MIRKPNFVKQIEYDGNHMAESDPFDLLQNFPLIKTAKELPKKYAACASGFAKSILRQGSRNVFSVAGGTLTYTNFFYPNNSIIEQTFEYEKGITTVRFEEGQDDLFRKCGLLKLILTKIASSDVKRVEDLTLKGRTRISSEYGHSCEKLHYQEMADNSWGFTFLKIYGIKPKMCRVTKQHQS